MNKYLDLIKRFVMKYEKVPLELDNDSYNMLKNKAKQEKKNIHQVVEEILKSYIEEEENKKIKNKKKGVRN